MPKSKLTEAEYLAIENAAEFKSEFYRGVMYPLYRSELTGMAGASRDHNRVKDNIAIRIGGLLFDCPCETYTSDQRVRLSLSGMYAYPAIVIVCDRPQFSELDRNTLVNPQIVIEVFSPSTARPARITSEPSTTAQAAPSTALASASSGTCGRWRCGLGGSGR